MAIFFLFSILGFLPTAQAASIETRFAFHEASGAPHLARVIYLQLEGASKEKFVKSCGLSGVKCGCEFFDKSNVKIGKASSGQVQYEENGNFFLCNFEGDLSRLSKVRLSTPRGAAGPKLSLKTELDIHQIFSSEHDINRVRGIYRYTCGFNYLQKAGTTQQYFDCSRQTANCNSSNQGDFCLLKARRSFHVFLDNYSQNFSERISDRTYGGGLDTICGLQIKEFDCTGVASTPQLQYGIYGENLGAWNTAIQLSPNPDFPTLTYGYVAKTTVFQGNTICPPGLERKTFYRAASMRSDPLSSSNFPTYLDLVEVASPNTKPNPFEVGQISGGKCNGINCERPTREEGTISSFDFSSVGQTEFCALPAKYLD